MDPGRSPKLKLTPNPLAVLPCATRYIITDGVKKKIKKGRLVAKKKIKKGRLVALPTSLRNRLKHLKTMVVSTVVD